jgi:N-acetylmuramoyl-L-alanine amidase
LPVVFQQNSSRNASIAEFTRENVVYGSLNDLLKIFVLKNTFDEQTGRMEFRGHGLAVRMFPDNPFVVITAADSSSNIAQLPYRVLRENNAFYVPVQWFLPIFQNLIEDDIAYDADAHRITVGKSVEDSGFDVTGMKIEEKENGTEVRILSRKPLKDYESWLKPEGNDTWLYVTLSSTKVDTTALAATSPAGMIRAVYVFPSPMSVQITFKVKGNIKSTEWLPSDGSNDLLLSIPAPRADDQPAQNSGDVNKTLDNERTRWKLDCIVLDAGHGGDDPGTIGVTRTKEKDVTLGIVLKLGKLLETNLRGVKVVYTRKTDEFIELYRRGQIANAAGGKLFISVHCNAAPHKPSEPHGFEIYLLRPGKTENAIRIAERENDVVKLEKGYENRYQTLDEEHFILLTMAQSAYVKYSEKFADILQQEMGHLDVENNGVKQAGFYVLVGASMPNVLVETAYLSNRHDEKILKSQKGQQRIADAIYSAVKRYKQEYEKSLSEGKEIGEGE